MESIEIPTICCMLQRLGSGFGQNGSTRYCGAPPASRAWRGITCAYPTDAAADATTRHKPALAAARVLAIGVLLLFLAPRRWRASGRLTSDGATTLANSKSRFMGRSEEHTFELQSLRH